MLNFSKIKILSILAVCFAAFIFAAPSFLQNKNNFLTKFLPSNKVNLGLDLRGGSQLMLEVDFDYYLQEQLSNLKDEIKLSFREESIRALPELIDGKIIFSLEDKEQKKLAEKIINKVSKRVDIDENDNKFQIYFSDQEVTRIRQNLIRQSIEIVRRRIDESGTKEPTIQAQGDSRILLQVPGVENSDEIKSILGKTAKMTFHFVSDDTFAGGAKSQILDTKLEAIPDAHGRTYLIEKEIALSGDLLTDANPTYHEGQPAVSFRFNETGTKKFAKLTAENIGRIFAIVLDGQVITAPRINGTINHPRVVWLFGSLFVRFCLFLLLFFHCV